MTSANTRSGRTGRWLFARRLRALANRPANPWADSAPPQQHPVLLVVDEITQYAEQARRAGEEGR